MWKTVVAGIAALTISGASLAFAQQAPRADVQRPRHSAEDHAAFTDARIAALRAGLKLSPEQEKHWPAAEAAIRSLAKQRFDAMEARRNARSADQSNARSDAMARLRRGSDWTSARAAALKQFAEATEPLYNSLDDSQKRRFSMLMRMGRPGSPHHHRRG